LLLNLQCMPRSCDLVRHHSNEFPVRFFPSRWWGLTWIVERTFAWLSQKSSLEQRLRVEGPNFGSLHRAGGHPPHAQTARPEVKLLKHPLRFDGVPLEQGLDLYPF
jgi:hypothetical protein